MKSLAVTIIVASLATAAMAADTDGPSGISNFLGISPDFKVCAVSDAGGVKVSDIKTGERLTSPTWDRDWGYPRSVVFGNNVIAVVTGNSSVKIFSRKTGELVQNVNGQVDDATFNADGRFLATTEFRPSHGFYLVVRDTQTKKTIAESQFGLNGYCSLAVAGNRVAVFASEGDVITVVDAKTGNIIKKIKSGSFRKTKDLGLGGRMALAISSAGNLFACDADDVVVLYDINNGKVTRRLEGHLDAVQAVVFSPNGQIVASAAMDKTIRFWTVKEGKEITTIKNLPARVFKLIFSADGAQIAIVYGERTMERAEIRNVEAK